MECLTAPWKAEQFHSLPFCFHSKQTLKIKVVLVGFILGGDVKHKNLLDRRTLSNPVRNVQKSFVFDFLIYHINLYSKRPNVT